MPCSRLLLPVVAVASVVALLAAAERQPAYPAGRRPLQWPHYHHHPSQAAAAPAPRKQLWKTRPAGGHLGEHVLARRQRHFLTSTMSPVLGHWRALHEKLEVQSMWPGTGKYAEEAYLLATTVRTARAGRRRRVDRTPRFIYVYV